MATIGYATLQIIPSLEGVSTGISSQLGAPLTAAGRKAGTDAGRAVADGMSAAKAAVEKAAATLAAAQNKAADATDKIAVAQAKYQALVAKGVTDVGRLAAAEAAVAKARRDSDTATTRASAAATGLARAEENAAKAAKNLGTESTSAAGGIRTLGASSDTAEGSLSRFGKIAAAGAGLAVLGGAVLDAGKAFLSIGETFANVNKTLQYTTGATGTSLDGMMESVNTIGKTSPKSLGEIATVLAKVSQRTNLTGSDLELLTKQVLKTSTVMGQDTDINTLTASFAAFGVTGSGASAAMDELFKASRATGVTVNELAAAAVKGAPQFQQFGLSLGQSAALMGSLDKAGLNSDVILTGLNKAMVNFAKDGRKPADALNETIASIEAMTKAGNDAGAIDLAASLFGTKGAGQFVNAVKSGAVSVAGLTAAVDANQQGILDAGGAIPTLSSAWALFKNNVMIALEPVATRVFGIFIDGLTWFRTTGVQTIQTVVGAFTGLLDGGVFAGLGDTFTVLRGVFDETMGGFRAFAAAFTDGGNEVTSSGVAGFLEQLGIYARDLADILGATVVPAVQSFAAVVAEVGSVALPIVASAVGLVAGVLVGLGEAVFAVVNFFKEHQDVAIALGGVLTATLLPTLLTMGAALAVQAGLWIAQTAALSAYILVQGAVNTATKAWAAVQWVLNAALTANPIGLVIGALAALVAGVVLAYRNSETFRNIVQGAWAGIQAAASAAWGLIKPVLDGLVAAFGWVVDAISPAIDFAAKYWDILIFGLGPIGMIVGAVVQVVKHFDLVKAAFSAAGDVAMWLYNTAIEPAFTGIGNLIAGTWNSVIAPSFEAMKTGFGAVGDFFGGVGNIIQGVWDGIVGGIKAAVRTIGGLLARLRNVPGLGWVGDAGAAMLDWAGHATGGLITGPGGPTDDLIPSLLSDGEFVVRASATKQNLPLLQALNAGWVPPAGLLHEMLPGFAGGGLVSADEVASFAQGVEGQPYVWGGVNWGDCSGAVSAVANYATGRDPFGSRFATGTEDSELAARGFLPGLGPAGSLNIGWFNGGEYGGHTALTLPNGTNFEMGGARGDGQYGGQAAGAADAMFTDHAHLPPDFFLGGDTMPSGVGNIPGGLSSGGGRGGGGWSAPSGGGGGGTSGGSSSGGSATPGTPAGDTVPVFVTNFPAGFTPSAAGATPPSAEAEAYTPGGTGSAPTYTGETAATWQEQTSQNFATGMAGAGKAFADGQLAGMPLGDTLGKVRDRGQQITLIVADMHEAVSKLRTLDKQQALAPGSRF
ncbi:phage tail tape measure protein [Rhodococcus jostii]|uniref:phage tail tape measure protein n=1 Tax=Rhodococcus jostii TaxID=132919 RepID=UPI0036340792